MANDIGDFRTTPGVSLSLGDQFLIRLARK